MGFTRAMFLAPVTSWFCSCKNVIAIRAGLLLEKHKVAVFGTHICCSGVVCVQSKGFVSPANGDLV